MGWYFSNNLDKKELVEAIVTGKEGYKVPIAHSLVGQHLWTVSENTDANGNTYRFIGLFLLQGGGRDMGWGYKPIDEDMGPVDHDCPLKFLELAPLSEHHGQYAREFRENVKAYHARKRADNQKRAKLQVGSVVKLIPGLTFGRGLKPEKLTITSVKPLRARDEHYMLYRIAPRHIEAVL